MDKNTSSLYANDNKEELLFIGSDSNLNMHYVRIPKIFMPYKENLGNVINSVFFSSFSNIVPKSFILNMQSRDVLYKFIEKHTRNLFLAISTEEELELLMRKEFKEMFSVEDETEFEKLYKRYNKGASIESYAFKFYKEKLLDYKRRLDEVEL